jgi:hypothetical protein
MSTDPKKITSINLWNAIEPKDNISFANPFAKSCIDDHKMPFCEWMTYVFNKFRLKSKE